MPLTQLRNDVATEAAKSSPAVAVTAATQWLGVSINEAVAIATLAYIVLQIAWLVYRWVCAVRDRNDNPGRRWTD